MFRTNRLKVAVIFDAYTICIDRVLVCKLLQGIEGEEISLLP